MEDNKVKIFINDTKEEPIQDKSISEYEQLINEELCISNNLLGNFVDGKYIIAKNIKEELVIGKKVQVDADEDKIYAVLRTKYEAYHVELLFEKFGESKSVAKFYVVEKIKEYEEDIKTFVAEFTSENRPDFKQTAREAFNIFIVNGEMETEDEEFENIDKRLEEFKKLKTQDIEFVTEMYSEIYIEKMLKELEKMGPLGQKIIKEYKAKLSEKGLDKKEVTTKLYTKMKKCLDKVIKDNGGIKEIAKNNQEIKKIVREYVEPIKTYREIARKEPEIIAPVPSVVNPGKSKSAPKKPEKKEEKKKDGKSGDKGGKGDKGKDKGKKDKDEKKDDKKKKRAIPNLSIFKDNQKQQKDDNKPNKPNKSDRSDALNPDKPPITPDNSSSMAEAFESLIKGGEVIAQENKEAEKNLANITNDGIANNDVIEAGNIEDNNPVAEGAVVTNPEIDSVEKHEGISKPVKEATENQIKDFSTASVEPIIEKGIEMI